MLLCRELAREIGYRDKSCPIYNTSPRGRLCEVAKQVGELRFTVWICYVTRESSVLVRRTFAGLRWFFISLKTFPYVHYRGGWQLAKLVSARVEQASRSALPQATTPKAPIRLSRRRKYSLAAARQTVASQRHLCLQIRKIRKVS